MKYYRSIEKIGSENMILRIDADGQAAFHGSEYGPDVDWDCGGNPRMSDWVEITQEEALELLYKWQMAEWSQLSDSYKISIARPERLAE